MLVVGARGALLVDTGVAGTPAATVLRALGALGALGLEPADLRHVVITHSDVDHSGGLGALLEAAPAATAIAHRLDVPWIDDVELLIDPPLPGAAARAQESVARRRPSSRRGETPSG